nr:hypothetical protein [Mesorhizobium loti]
MTKAQRAFRLNEIRRAAGKRPRRPARGCDLGNRGDTGGCPPLQVQPAGFAGTIADAFFAQQHGENIEEFDLDGARPAGSQKPYPAFETVIANAGPMTQRRDNHRTCRGQIKDKNLPPALRDTVAFGELETASTPFPHKRIEEPIHGWCNITMYIFFYNRIHFFKPLIVAIIYISWN